MGLEGQGGDQREIDRILITGAEGFFASRLVDCYADRYRVTGTGRRELDFTDEDETARCLERIAPSLVIHCGAVSDTAACAENPEASGLVNVAGAENIARACRAFGSRLIFCSSDYVYFGSAGMEPHTEEEKLQPVTVYGRQKLEAELRCLAANPDTVCLRLSWMYDIERRSEREHGNLLVNLLEAVRKGERLRFPVNDYRSITYVWEAARRMEGVFSLPAGVYNFGSINGRSTYETVKLFQRAFGLEEWLAEADEASFSDRPRNLMMSVEKAERRGVRLQSTSDGIFECAGKAGCCNRNSGL